MFFSNMVRKIINKEEQVTAIDPNIAEYNQQLIAALQATDVAGVKLALEQGADPNTCGNKQRPAIVIAAGSRSNSTGLVNALITHSDIPVDLDQRSKLEDGGWTALMTAVANKNYDSVNLLLRAGCNTKLKHNFGCTASKVARMHDMGELSKTIKKFRKLEITPQLLDTEAYTVGKCFAKTKYYYVRSNKKTHFTRPLPEEVLMLIGSFLYPKSRLNKHFVVGFDKVKQKTIKAKANKI